MGCFSFVCKNSFRSVESTGSDGHAVYLYLLKDGKVIEEMYGNYDSYGRVFSNEIEDEETGQRKSFIWKTKWHSVVDLMFSSSDKDGIAAVLASAKDKKIPTTRSKDDPNQGWGANFELFGDFSNNKFEKVLEPYHKVY